MRDIALDPVTGDLALEVSGGATRLRLTDPTTGEATRQRLYLRLSLWQGEYEIDTRQGIPYHLFLGRKGTEAVFGATLRQAAATCPGVDAVTAFALAVDPATRAATLDPFEVRAVTGDVVDLGGFVAGDVGVAAEGT